MQRQELPSYRREGLQQRERGGQGAEPPARTEAGQPDQHRVQVGALTLRDQLGPNPQPQLSSRAHLPGQLSWETPWPRGACGGTALPSRHRCCLQPSLLLAWLPLSSRCRYSLLLPLLANPEHIRVWGSLHYSKTEKVVKRSRMKRANPRSSVTSTEHLFCFHMKTSLCWHASYPCSSFFVFFFSPNRHFSAF